MKTRRMFTVESNKVEMDFVLEQVFILGVVFEFLFNFL